MQSMLSTSSVTCSRRILASEVCVILIVGPRCWGASLGHLIAWRCHTQRRLSRFYLVPTTWTLSLSHLVSLRRSLARIHFTNHCGGDKCSTNRSTGTLQFKCLTIRI